MNIVGFSMVLLSWLFYFCLSWFVVNSWFFYLLKMWKLKDCIIILGVVNIFSFLLRLLLFGEKVFGIKKVGLFVLNLGFIIICCISDL